MLAGIQGSHVGVGVPALREDTSAGSARRRADEAGVLRRWMRRWMCRKGLRVAPGIHVIASDHFICPLKPKSVAMLRY